ncbi:dephospho-CoA kinase [Polaribacter sp.]|uniref:dephospho-CoA kinase n=1 Tax=Polaribacter sp. TaxID=1920175 RepID=UPI0025E80BFE|nr:dephospho-CoA kinase [Polaribacter sp.]
MKIVGLTGGIGSGKSTVANYFSSFDNVAIYIADEEAKKLMQTSQIIKQKINEVFGANAYIDNYLNKKYISNIVFKDSSKLDALNKIVHPEVRKNFHNFVKEQRNKEIIIYEAAILFESDNSQFCDFIITVYANSSTRIKRVIGRDNVSKENVLYRMKNQLSDTYKLLQSNYIIYNDDLNKTKDQVQKVHKILTEKS